MSVQINNISYLYDRHTPNETKALDQVSLNIEEGTFLGLIGHTGSGKSTLIQHLNALLTPTEGTIVVSGLDITQGTQAILGKKSRREKKKLETERKKKILEVRKRVGLVFQYPEYQLFEETVEKDIAFGPQNLGLSSEEVERRVRDSMEKVGLSYEDFKDRSPFELSGGQKRRVAIAGVIAMKPDVLILDEPTAGLDPRGRDEILAQIKKLHEVEKITVITVSHSMEDMAKVAERLIVMNKGKVILDGKPAEVFKHIQTLEDIGLAVPQVSYLVKALNEKGFNLSEEIITVEQAYEAIKDAVGFKEEKLC